ncbi:hypothetical protein [Methanimicrococcus blatticola]|uniref:hypothetical protein n=1 Tax=Methanimicrococcus blatticola TaxID=91560 RepID=UPI00105EA1F5|nr:hypothetical protein [Methanimicrococcus blatticola]MBZ3934904.1 hypothetical protein [Methanimicrococcus blatticola]MCC2508997.1 hypothetical protein [Methanimicrococcus blatticola]
MHAVALTVSMAAPTATIEAKTEAATKIKAAGRLSKLRFLFMPSLSLNSRKFRFCSSLRSDQNSELAVVFEGLIHF